MTLFTSRTNIPAGGFVDNASALPTTPPAHQSQAKRTFHSSSKADIFTRHQHFTHTEVPEALEGHGVASKLIAGALEDVRRRDLKIVSAFR